jgi:hypothetical protein
VPWRSQLTSGGKKALACTVGGSPRWSRLSWALKATRILPGGHVTIKLRQAHLTDCALTYTAHRWISLEIRATGSTGKRLGATMPLESTGKDLMQLHVAWQLYYSSRWQVITLRFPRHHYHSRWKSFRSSNSLFCLLPRVNNLNHGTILIILCHYLVRPFQQTKWQNQRVL